MTKATTTSGGRAGEQPRIHLFFSQRRKRKEGGSSQQSSQAVKSSEAGRRGPSSSVAVLVTVLPIYSALIKGRSVIKVVQHI